MEEAAGGTSEAQARAPGLKLETNESLAPPPGAATPTTPLLSGACAPPSSTYSDAKVANRIARVWHGVTANGP